MDDATRNKLDEIVNSFRRQIAQPHTVIESAVIWAQLKVALRGWGNEIETLAKAEAAATAKTDPS